MDYLAVKDLKKTRELWAKLASERELVITKDGKPSALDDQRLSRDLRRVVARDSSDTLFGRREPGAEAGRDGGNARRCGDCSRDCPEQEGTRP